MALFRKHRRQRPSDTSKAARRTERPASQPTSALLEQLQAIAASATVPEDALEPALKAIIENTGASAGALCLFDQRHAVLRLSTEYGVSDEGCRRLRTIRRGDPSCWDIPLHGVVNRRAYLIENASQNRYVPALLGKQTPMRTIACVPVYGGVTALASIILVTAPPRSFAERDIAMLWKPLRELAGMIEAIRRQVAASEPSSSEPAMPAPLDLLSLTADRDRLRTELAGRSAELHRLTSQLGTMREEATRLHTAFETATAERSEIARELERVRTESEDTTTLAQALADAERERQRLAEALGAAAADAAEREKRAAAQARHDAETASAARDAEWDAARRTYSEQIAANARLAEERDAEIARLTARLSELETGAIAGRGRDTRREGEIARLTAALEAAASRETDLRARLAAREAERLAAAEPELAAAREALDTAEITRARAEERAAGLDAELETSRRVLEELQAELTAAREEIARLRESEQTAVTEAARREAALAEMQSLEVEARTRLEVAERVLAEVTAERDRAHEEARGRQSGLTQAEARLEAIAAERDQLREALARSEAECARLRTALDAAQSEDARVAGALAQERAEQARIAERLAETEAAVARLEAVSKEQQSELAEREAEIVRLTAAQAHLLAERDRLVADRAEIASVTVDAADLEAAAVVAPGAGVTVTRPDATVTVINVHDAAGEPAFVASGAPVIVVLDADRAWSRVGATGYDVAVIQPGASSVTRIRELEPERVIVNLAAPGALTALLALRAGGVTTRLLGCIADPAKEQAIGLGAVEPVVGPIDPDAIIAALGSYAARDGRVVTAGADVDALMSLRQALSRRRASVSMAWDAKQARELLGVVRPHAVVVDMSMPKRDGCAILAALTACESMPLTVLVAGSADPASDFTALLADPPRDLPIGNLRAVLAQLAAYNDESLPRIGQQEAKRLRVAQGPRWVG
jgi:CheY-like chemotaxis protein